MRFKKNISTVPEVWIASASFRLVIGDSKFNSAWTKSENHELLILNKVLHTNLSQSCIDFLNKGNFTKFAFM